MGECRVLYGRCMCACREPGRTDRLPVEYEVKHYFPVVRTDRDLQSVGECEPFQSRRKWKFSDALKEFCGEKQTKNREPKKDRIV